MKTTLKTPSKSMASILVASFFAVGFAALGSGRVQAAEPQEGLKETVAYGDLNLDSEQGAKVLYSRLRRAAQHVCAPLEGRDLTQRQLWESCYDNALASAVVRVNKTMVTALHNNQPPKG
jgi:UrcA family protein